MASLSHIKKDLEELPPEDLKEVSRLVQALLARNLAPADMTPDSAGGTGYGWAKGLITVPIDFDEPLEDFQEYME
jgi:hypothetical protein